MNCYRFRVIIDHDANIFRDIDIAQDAPLEDLHRSILLAFNFSQGEMASFFTCNDDWERADEFHLMDMGRNDLGEPFPSMRTTKLSEVVSTVGDKLVYVYDFMRMWCFHVELDSVQEAALEELPRLAKEFGDAPSQFSKGSEMFADIEDADTGGTGGAEADDGPVLTGDPEIDAILKEEYELKHGGGESAEGGSDAFDSQNLTSLDDLEDLH